MDFFIGLARCQRSEKRIGRWRVLFCVVRGPGLSQCPRRPSVTAVR